jgi:hypothetical protein
MNKLKMLSAFFIFFIFSTFLFAQQNDVKKTQLPQLTVEQKLDRAVANSVSYMIFGISFAKSLGQSTEDYATYCANIAAPLYQGFKGANPLSIVKTIYTVQQSDKNLKLEILESSEKSLKAKMTLYGIQYINPTNPFGGVTVKDCYNFYNIFMEKFSSSLDFEYKYEVKNDWIYFVLKSI